MTHLPSFIKPGKFLPTTVHPDDVNLYKLNSDQYRTYEWSDIDWKNAVVLFGCSHAFGVGVDDENTISYNLSKLLDRQVVNLGMAGTSIFYSFYNSIVLAESFPIPWAVFHLWTTPDRITTCSSKELLHIGLWADHSQVCYRDWNLCPENSAFHSKFILTAGELLWSNKCRYGAGTMFDVEHMYDDYNCMYFNYLDQGTDNLHPGPKTTKYIAEEIAKNYLTTK